MSSNYEKNLIEKISICFQYNHLVYYTVTTFYVHNIIHCYIKLHTCTLPMYILHVGI